MSSYEHLIVDDAGGVRTITLNRPERLNAVNAALSSSVQRAMSDAAKDDAVRVVVLTGAGRGFCSGLDLSEPPELPSGTRAERLEQYAWVGAWVKAVVECEKPVIAAVNGSAAGAGFGLALTADIRIMASGARLSAGYVRRGLSPDAGVSYFLPRHIGLARASELLLTGRDMDANEALRVGLVAAVHEEAELMAAVSRFASTLAAGAPVAQALTKRLLSRTFDQSLEATLRDELSLIKYCFATQDVGEAIRAFREKRPPEFRGS